MGWLMVRKHPEVIEKGSKIDLSDLESDKLVMWQHKNYIPLALITCIMIPTLIPVYFWRETLWLSYFSTIFRYVKKCIKGYSEMLGHHQKLIAFLSGVQAFITLDYSNFIKYLLKVMES